MLTNLPLQHCCLTLSISISLTVTCNSTVHTEWIVVFLQQIGYAYIPQC